MGWRRRVPLSGALLGIVALAFAARSAAAQSVAMNADLAAVVEAAKKEGRLDLRSTSTVLGGPEGARVAKDGIKRMFGVDLDVKWAPGPAYGPLAAILNQERQAGARASTDAFTATAVQYSPYMASGLFAPTPWTKLAPGRITDAIVEGDGRLLRHDTAVPSILYNVEEAPWAARIKSFDELLDPKLKGKFYTTPFLAGFDVMLSKEKWGVEATTERVKKLSKQIGGLLGCEGVDRIASGEIAALVVDCSGAWHNALKFRGKGVIGDHVVPDMAQRRMAYLSIPTHAAHPNAGILYALYIVSPEGQEKIQWDLFGGGLLDFPDSRRKPQFDALEKSGVTFVDVTMDWWRSNPGIDKINESLARIVREP
jgi:ABC-type Fe3+ transport system substrate-binding protein